MDSKTIFVVIFRYNVGNTENKVYITSFISLEDAIDLIDVLNGVLEGDSELDYQLNDDQLKIISDVMDTVNYTDKERYIFNVIEYKKIMGKMKFEVETLTIFPKGSKLI